MQLFDGYHRVSLGVEGIGLISANSHHGVSYTISTVMADWVSGASSAELSTNLCPGEVNEENGGIELSQSSWLTSGSGAAGASLLSV